MSSNEIELPDLYNLVLQRLNEFGATDLISGIDEVVLRGAISPDDEQKIDKKSQLVRKMQPHEVLAVALEFLESAAQVPFMLKSAIETFHCEEIFWLPDGPPVPPQTNEGIEDDTEKMPLLSNQNFNEVKSNLDQPGTEEISAPRQGASALSILDQIDLKALEEVLTRLVLLKSELNIRLPEAV